MRGWSIAAVGGPAWLVAVLVLQPPILVGLLLLGPFVLVPLALGLAHPGGPQGRFQGRWKIAGSAVLPLAALAAAAFWFPAGPIAAAFTVPWFVLTLFLAALAFLRLVELGWRASEVAVNAGVGLVAVGGFWLFASRAGLPLGYLEPIPILTAAHFHVAGVALPMLAGLAARARRTRFAKGAALASVFAFPLVAIGITLQPMGIEWVNAVSVVVLACAAAGVALVQMRNAFAQPSSARLAALASSAAILVGMTLAVLYAWGRLGGPIVLTIDQMLRSHAVLNSFGFALLGMLAWTVAGVPAAPAGFQVVLPWLGDRPDAAAWSGRAIGATPRLPGDIEDRYARVIGREAPGPPVTDGTFARAARVVLAYDLFPPKLLRPVSRIERAKPGDALVGLHPAFPGVGVVIASRVIEVFDGPSGDGWRTGFTYATLEGHAECGEETMAVEKDPDGRITIVLSSWSRPGHSTSRLLRRFVRSRQVAAGNGALDHVERLAGSEPAGRPAAGA